MEYELTITFRATEELSVAQLNAARSDFGYRLQGYTTPTLPYITGELTLTYKDLDQHGKKQTT